MLSLPLAERRDINSLQNWVDSTGCLARDETKYLAHGHELVSLGLTADNAVLHLKTWVEDKLIRYWRWFRINHGHDLSIDLDIFVYKGPLIRLTAKALLYFLITLLLTVPIIMCNLITTMSTRMIIVMFFIISYLLVLSGLTKSRIYFIIVVLQAPFTLDCLPHIN
ncbi:hypothetical protein BKA67DRAFT_567712 [Truncatella angustata]|uniref:DUF6594 domain-containing protein n=1 Tax=Truncatella angustata TaxID=152316 RepID=A0A9P8ZX88_9PEZI|nr:uncharacterized protein BKA67DRAFT_567712 [Truncatella angustata]KAH6652848.1 hypothetical protein BKA67DRAFT_567712 [Truncatella angustata]